MNEVQGGGGGIYRNHSVCLSVCFRLFVQIRVRPITFLGLTWLTIFSTLVYIHETICRVHSWSRYDLKLWPKRQIYRVLDMLSCPVHNFFWIDIGLPYLAHGCITIRRRVSYIHDPDVTLNFDLKVKFIGFLTFFRVLFITFFWIDIGYHIWHMGVSP